MNDPGRADEADDVDVDEELADAWSAAERQGHRADFFESLARELAQEVASTAHDAAVASATNALQEAEANGLEAEAASAWHEAALVLQADEHALRQTVHDDLYSAAHGAVTRLTLTQRQCLWLTLEPRESDAGADLWGKPVSPGFDPLTAYSSALDPAVEAIAGDLAHSLRRADLAALASTA